MNVGGKNALNLVKIKVPPQGYALKIKKWVDSSITTALGT